MSDPPGPSDADLTRLLDESRGHEAAQERSRRRWLRQQALEEASLAGALRAAAEQQHIVTLRLTSGRAHTGTVVELGADYCALRSAAALALVRLTAIAVIVPDRSLHALPAADPRTDVGHRTFIEALGDLAPERPAVVLAFSGAADPVGGALVAVGTDLATVAIDGQYSLAYVSLASVTDASFLGSG